MSCYSVLTMTDSTSLYAPIHASSLAQRSNQEAGQLGLSSPPRARHLPTPEERGVLSQRCIPSQRSTPSQRSDPSQRCIPSQRSDLSQRSVPSQRSIPFQRSDPSQRDASSRAHALGAGSSKPSTPARLSTPLFPHTSHAEPTRTDFPERAIEPQAIAPLSLFPDFIAHASSALNDPASPPFELHQADAVSFLQSLPAESVDLVVTDPPYESLEKHRAIGTTTRLKHSKASSNDWFPIFKNQRFPELFQELYRVLKKHRHFYLFCDQETMFVAKPLAEQAGFKFWKPLIWDKQKIGMGYHYRSRYEMILFFEKGKRKLNNLSIPDILSAPRILKGYPTEKPVSLVETLVLQSSSAGEQVVDPFCGSGATGVAALQNGRRFSGSDINPKAIKWASERLEAHG